MGTHIREQERLEDQDILITEKAKLALSSAGSFYHNAASKGASSLSAAEFNAVQMTLDKLQVKEVRCENPHCEQVCWDVDSNIPVDEPYFCSNTCLRQAFNLDED